MFLQVFLPRRVEPVLYTDELREAKARLLVVQERAKIDESGRIEVRGLADEPTTGQLVFSKRV
jgi:hypothetical protein